MTYRGLKYDQFNGTLKCAYTYLADGTKVMVQDNANSSSSNGYLYLGSMVFRKTGTSYAFESTDFGVGRIINVNGTLSPYYYTTDHLGSVRVITDASGNVTERNDCYPFGKRMTTGNTYPTTSSNRWKYNGKEVQTTGGVNWLDYGAREYDEVIGRWTRPDPMSEKYYGTSSYAYVRNNPILKIDITGMLDDDYYFNKNGSLQSVIHNKKPDRVFIQSSNNQHNLLYNEYNAKAVKQFVAVVSGESSNDAAEAEGIGHVMLNRLAYKGAELKEGFMQKISAGGNVKSNFNAMGTDTYNTIMEQPLYESATGKYAERMEGAIKSLSESSRDNTNGAYFWNATSQQFKANPGVNFMALKRNIFVRTATIGQTTFFKYNPNKNENPSHYKSVWP